MADATVSYSKKTKTASCICNFVSQKQAGHSSFFLSVD